MLLSLSYCLLQKPGLAEDLLHRPELAGIGDDRANPERPRGGVRKGRPRQQRIARPEQGVRVGGLDDPGHDEFNIVGHARIFVRGDADGHPRACLKPEPAGQRLGDHDLDDRVDCVGRERGGRHAAGHQPQVAGQRVAVGHLQLRGDPSQFVEYGEPAQAVRLGGQRRPVGRRRGQGERAAAEIAAQLSGDGGEVSLAQLDGGAALGGAAAAEGGVDQGPGGRGDHALIER